MVFRVAWGLAVKLTETTDILEANRGLAHRFIVRIDGLNSAEVERGPEQHRGVAVGQHETITVGPDWILRIEAENAIPDRIDQRCEGHGRAGMSRVGLLHGVHGQGANSIDT